MNKRNILIADVLSRFGDEWMERDTLQERAWGRRCKQIAGEIYLWEKDLGFEDFHSGLPLEPVT
jgi:hypothetical protein